MNASPSPHPDPSAVILAINSAFGRQPPPLPDETVAGTPDDPQRQRIRAALSGMPWWDLPFETLVSLRSALAFLSPLSYRYYLPAFMIFCLTDFRRADVLSEEIVLGLIRPESADAEKLRLLADDGGFGQQFSTSEVLALIADQEDYYASGRAEQEFLDRVAGFTGAQRSAIRAFLAYLDVVHGDDFPGHGPQVALDRYWASAQ